MSGQGGKLKFRGRGGFHRDNGNKPKSGWFTLQRNATASDTNNWLDKAKDWGNEELDYNVGELARPHQPGLVNYPEPPRRPDRDDQDEEGNFIYAHEGAPLFADNGELTKRGNEMYKEDYDIFRSRLDKYDSAVLKIEKDKVKLHGKLEAMMSIDARNELERKYSSNIWIDKDPVALIDAIRTVFVGQLTGGAGNKMSRTRLRSSLYTISRTQGESQVFFSRRFTDLIESYKHSELQAGREQEQLDTELNDEQLVNFYVQGCGLSEWQWELEYNPEVEPYPETLTAAIKRAIEFEEGIAKKNKGGNKAEFATFQAFLAYQNQKQQSGKANQSSGGGQQGKAEHSKEKDEDGVPICTSFRNGQCKWTAAHPDGPKCKYSHKVAVNSNPSSAAAMTSAAVAQVNKGTVAFAPNSSAGGSGASSGTGTKKSSNG